MACVTAVAWFQPLAQELLHAIGTAKKLKKKKKSIKELFGVPVVAQ